VGQSNGEWGSLDNDATRERHDEWIAYEPLASVDGPLLAQFLEDKGLQAADLARVGARWKPPDTLVYFFPEGLKYRRLTDDRRWNTPGTEWLAPKVVARPGRAARGVLVAEGETDAAALAAAWGEHYDVAILPAGARGLPPQLHAVLSPYARVLVALDADAAGDEGGREVLALVPGSRRLRPPDGDDWCAVLRHQRAVDDPWELTSGPPRQVFSLRELFEADLGEEEDNHWFEHRVLPQRGQAILHGAVKSLKSWAMIETVRALTTGTTLMGRFEYLPESPARVLMFQFEVPPYDFRERMLSVAEGIPEHEREAMLDNFFVHRLADNQFSRLRLSPDLADVIASCAAEADAQVIMFDPLQRMLGAASVDKANEIDPLLSVYSDLQANGFTVVYSHHNSKAGGKMAKDPYATAGSQRVVGDPDSIWSLWQSKGCIDDDNSDGVKQRNISFTLRSGSAPSRSITLVPGNDIISLVFDEYISNTVDATDDMEDM
jgi:AAA domain/Toprim-like